MNTTMRFAVLSLAALLALAVEAAPDFRAPLDKAGVGKQVWAQANPWYPFDMPGTLSQGGPNVPWRKYEGEDVWAQGLEDVARYGMNAVLIEMNEPNGFDAVWSQVRGEVKRRGLDFKVGMFFGMYSKTPEESIANIKRILGPYREDLKSDPGILRIGGAPVMHVYTPVRFKPEEWKRIFDAVDAEFGRMAYLLCYSSLKCRRYHDFENQLRAYLPYFDGVTSYAFSNETLGIQKEEREILERVMAEYPHKVYVGGPFAGYMMHFSTAGTEPHLSSDWRESVDLWLGSSADAVQLTNVFDHYENSLVLPCYEREDLLLRYLEYALSKWRGTPFRRERKPELVLCNYAGALVGWRTLDYEVLGFPVDSDAQDVSFRVELCDTSGRVLRTLETRRMKLDAFRAERFSVPSEDFVDERGVVPRLVYTWKGREYKAPYNPMTVVTPSLVCYRHYWARSTKNALEVSEKGEWSVDGAGPGGTFAPAAGGIAVFDSHIRAAKGKAPSQGYFRHAYKRDYSEYRAVRDAYPELDGQLALPVPDPRGSLHWYSLEIENRLGHRYQTLPVWNTDGSRARKVAMPLLNGRGEVFEHDVEEARVPYFDWPCDRDGGSVVLDVSGYEHHGRVNGRGFGGGHHEYTGYNHLHNGVVQEKPAKLHRRDPDGKGYYRLGGEDYLTLMGSTVVPGAGTYEISVRPAVANQYAGILSSGREQVALDVLSNGCVQVSRRRIPDTKTYPYPMDRAVSEHALPAGEWTDVAVVYDLREMRLYFNGRLEARTPASPNFYPSGFGRPHWAYLTDEYIGNMIAGAACVQPTTPTRCFRGDIRAIRVTGRNLPPEELLGSKAK